jgi:hypothetical protein|tara:strand:+ start:2198 stop:2422 length:225 start_codon:yes stop_codon:yes gene_type:complete
MFELLIFLFVDVDTRMGNFYTLKQKFNTYHECVEYVEQHRTDSITGFGQVFTLTAQPPIFEGRIIGLTYCKPIS